MTTQTHTVDFTTPAQAKLVLDQVGGYAYRNGTMIEMDDSALESLRDLPEDADGYCDGARVYVGAEVGTGRHAYRVDTETIHQDTVYDHFGY